MIDPYEFLASAVLVIKSDIKLKNAFNQILGTANSSPQTRVSLLQEKLNELGAPFEVKTFCQLPHPRTLAAFDIVSRNNDVYSSSSTRPAVVGEPKMF